MFGLFKKFPFTDPFKPKIQVDTELGAKTYFNGLSKLTSDELYKEFANVMAAKYNVINMPVIRDIAKKQRTVTDLTDKATLICIYRFGNDTLMNFSNNDLRVVNQLINTFDEQVARQNLEPIEHGKRLITKLEQAIL